MRGAGGRQLPARPAEQDCRDAALPPMPFCSDTQGAHVHPWITRPENRTPEVSRVSAYQGGWGSPAGPSLSRAYPHGAEQGLAGLDRAGRGGAVGSGRG